ncbi:MAG: FHA domain-containing protein [Polyangiaceae bacterium]|nr:FHA domain-containing protein [Polyangiaceae bacterium]
MPYRFAECELDERTRTLTKSGTTISIEPKVFDFLLYLIEHRDRLVPKNELLAVLWPQVIVHESALARLAMEARRAVGDAGRVQHTIETRRGHGYRFTAKVTPSQIGAPAPVGRSPLGGANESAPAKWSHRLGPADTTAVESARLDDDPGELVIRWLFPRHGVVSWARGQATCIGRGPECTVVLDGAEVSRRHAELVRVGPVCGIRDLGSSNGTYVNGNRITERALAERDVVRCGEWVGVVVQAETLPADIRAGLRMLAQGLLGGPELAAALAPIERAAPTTIPIVLQGRPGAGKATVARAIHQWSRRPGELVVVTQQSGPDATATWSPRGGPSDFASSLLRRAHEGTLLLENVIELGPELQASLAVAIEANEATRSAGQHARDVRVVATTDMAFLEAVAQARIHPVLGKCLGGIVVEVPSLTERLADVPELFLTLLSEYAGDRALEVTARVVERLCLHPWPGNVEELVVLARRLAAVHASKKVVGRGDLPPELLGLGGSWGRM